MSAARTLGSVLVTGAAGFIGSAVVRRLVARHPDARVVSLDALTYAGDEANLAGLPPERHTFVRGDVCDQPLVERLLRGHGVDTVLHLAAESHVDRSITGAAEFLRTNVQGTFSVLEAARSAWQGGAGRVHLVSTDEVYGDLPPSAPASREGDPYQPSSPYSASKAASDHLGLAWHRTYGLPVTISHGSNTYGPRQYPEKLIPVVVRAAVRGAPIPVYGDGQQVRDWLHVDDHAAGILAAASRGVPGRVYNLGGENPRVNLELVHALCAVLDELRPAGAPHARHVRFVTDRPGHDRRYALQIDRAREELGWAPVVPWEQGLRETVQALLG